MKKILLIFTHLIVIFGVLISTGILLSKKDTTISNTKFTGVLEENVVIKVLENDIAKEQGYLDELLTAFNEEYAEYGIEAVDANMDESSDLINDGPYGYGPDVLYQANDLIMTYIDGKHVLPIDRSLIEADEYISDNAYKAFKQTVSGVDYNFAVPVNIQTPLLYYRKDLLDTIIPNWRVTYDKNQNGTCDIFEDLNSMYRFAAEVNKNNNNQYGIVVPTSEPYFMFGYLLSYGAYVFGDEGTNPDDIGLANKDSYKGLNIIRQLSSVMPQGVTDGSVVQPAYGNLARGNYFSVITTPDVQTMFERELRKAHGNNINIDDYLGVVPLPKLPKSGDLTEENPELIDNISMGGVHGYCISSYTEAPNAALAFVNFATNYEMIKARNEYLGIAPARQDVSEDIGGISETVNELLATGKIYTMPSISAVKQIWTPMTTLFVNISSDAFRKEDEKLFLDENRRKEELDKAINQIYDAIHTLQ